MSFLREDKELAAPPLPITESREGYQKLQARLERLHRRHPDAHIHLRIDAAGQYAANLEAFVRSLDHLPMTVSVGEPKRNKDYHRVHSPKRKQDASESLAMARYAVVERPQPSHGKPLAFAALRRVASRLQGQTKQTTRLTNQLHETLAASFPELATITSVITTGWVLELLKKYPTAERIAAARLSSIESIAFLKPEKAAQVHRAAKHSVAALSGEVAEAPASMEPVAGEMGGPSSTHSASNATPRQASCRNGRSIDYQALRDRVTFDQVLRAIGQPVRNSSQHRGPCPLHEPESTSGRSFSVNLKRNIFRCFDSACRAQGNVLEFWMAYRKLPLYEAAEDLARTMRIELPTNQRSAPKTKKTKTKK